MPSGPVLVESIVVIWRRYTDWLSAYMPMAYDNLAPGATDAFSDPSRPGPLPMGIVPALSTTAETAAILRDEYHILVVDVGPSERSQAVAGRFIDLDRDPMPAIVVRSSDGPVRVAATGRQLPPGRTGDQIACASSVNAAATRNAGRVSTASSRWPRRRFCTTA